MSEKTAFVCSLTVTDQTFDTAKETFQMQFRALLEGELTQICV